jgi:trimethylamine monooxygenase
MAELFKQWEQHKIEGIVTYRDRSYASTLTGTMAPPHHTRWMQALDDSLEAFLGS